MLTFALYGGAGWSWMFVVSFLFAANAVASLALVTMSHEIDDSRKPAFMNPSELGGCLLFVLTPWGGAKYLTPNYLFSRLIAGMLRADSRRTDAFLLGDKDDLEHEFFGRAAALAGRAPLL
jgi:hypothetical protein